MFPVNVSSGLIWLHLHENIHNPLGNVSVKRVIGGKNGNIVFTDKSFVFEIGCSHANAKFLDLIGTGNYTAVIIGKHHHRFVRQIRPEETFTGNIEIVAVNQTINLFIFRRLRH